MTAQAGKRILSHSTPGKPRGPHARTLAAQEIIQEVVNQLGGAKRLLAWVREHEDHETIFWSSIFVKMLPLKVDQHLTITHEEALDELERRFPRFIDGKPVKYTEKLKSPHIEPN